MVFLMTGNHLGCQLAMGVYLIHIRLIPRHAVVNANCSAIAESSDVLVVCILGWLLTCLRTPQVLTVSAEPMARTILWHVRSQNLPFTVSFWQATCVNRNLKSISVNKSAESPYDRTHHPTAEPIYSSTADNTKINKTKLLQMNCCVWEHQSRSED